MVNRDVVVAKIAHIRESLNRLEEKQEISANHFLKDKDTQDIVLFNLQIAIQGCVDIASHIIADNDWGVVENLGGLFDTLARKKVISIKTKKTMRKMVGFRNLIVHEYASLNMSLVYTLLKENLNDFNLFLREISRYARL